MLNRFRIIKTSKANNDMFYLFGRLDAMTASKLENVISMEMLNKGIVFFDLSSLEYISGAGLRALLIAKKKSMLAGSRAVLISPNDFIMEVLIATGFDCIFEIEGQPTRLLNNRGSLPGILKD